MTEAKYLPPPVQNLLKRGVLIRSPFSMEVDESVDPERIAPGVILHSGCRITGHKTSIGPGSELGKEGPVVIEDCQLGHNVELKGGFFSGATFLEGAGMGSGAHIRQDTLLEEGSCGAHAVGLKMTIFLPYVIAGSLINFCDAFMSGGTSRENHSEIGSSYIHFNFTPHLDKATPSLVGEVPRGVFLDQRPIFLGGQGGLVGPVRIAYGTVIPAGKICRRDVLEEDELFAAGDAKGETRAFTAGAYRRIDRIVKNNLIYIGNLWALRAWYQNVRTRTVRADVYGKACHAGALARIEGNLEERVRRLKDLAGKMPLSLKLLRDESAKNVPPEIYARQIELIDRWPDIEAHLHAGPPAGAGAAQRDVFLREWEQTDAASGHLQAVSALSPSARKTGAVWLQSIVDSAAALWKEI